MLSQLLFYKTVSPLSAERHGDCFVEIGENYEFSHHVNSVPLMAVEFAPAAAEYAIVFAGTESSLIPAVILGIRNNENLFLNAENIWQAKYVPAFVRRYPFVFSNSPDGQRLTLCIDEAFAGFNREGRGQRLFNDDGKPTDYVDNVLKFLQDFQAQFVRTQAFCNKVRELKLLEPVQAQVELTSGERLSLSGFMAVNRQRLKAVPGDKLAELAQSDELELLYLHLQSMRNFLTLRDRLVIAGGGGSGGAAAFDNNGGSAGNGAPNSRNGSADGGAE